MNQAPPHKASMPSTIIPNTAALMAEPTADGLGLNPPQRGQRIAPDATGWYSQ
jgi:hypothetical protein